MQIIVVLTFKRDKFKYKIPKEDHKYFSPRK